MHHRYCLEENEAMALNPTDPARTERAREVENALASVRMEGLEPSDEAKALLQRYVNGEVTSENLDRSFDLYFDRKYGPVRLPRHDPS